MTKLRIEPEISGVSVVLLGDFNPAIFTPAWFALQKLLPSAVAENAEVAGVHPQISAFAAEWLRLQVTRDRFEAETQKEPYVRLRDVVLEVLQECLPHTPVRAFGINRYVHFRVTGPEVRDQVGMKLAPRDPWQGCADIFELDGKYDGLTSLTMRHGEPEGRPKGGHINVTVEPSGLVGGGGSGVYVRVNDHWVTDAGSPRGRAELLESLEAAFEASIRRANQIVDHVMSLADPS